MIVVVREEDRQMWFYVVTWLPLLSISLTAAICFGVASFVMGQVRWPSLAYAVQTARRR